MIKNIIKFYRARGREPSINEIRRNPDMDRFMIYKNVTCKFRDEQERRMFFKGFRLGQEFEGIAEDSPHWQNEDEKYELT